jgi:hypothetical protein
MMRTVAVSTADRMTIRTTSHDGIPDDRMAEIEFTPTMISSLAM